MRGEKILVVGPTGNTGPPICRYLVESNEVWALARFSSPGAESRLKDMGVVTFTADLANGDLVDLPDDFTYVVNLAAFIGPGYDFDYAMTVNAEAPGLVMLHCRKARAFLHVSTGGVYAPFPDPWYRKVETDPTQPPSYPFSPTYGLSKLAGEAVVRTMALKKRDRLASPAAAMIPSSLVNPSRVASLGSALTSRLPGGGRSSPGRHPICTSAIGNRAHSSQPARIRSPPRRRCSEC